MKSSELRIGNWVIVHHNDVEIDFITNKEIVGAKGLHLTELKKVKPIPLTEEWLLKFGFIRHHYDYANDVIYIKNIADNEIDNAEFEWGVYPNELGSGIQIKNRKSLKYVHEIQNLYFALTGEELTFKSE